MATTAQEVITISSIGQYGPKVGSVFYGISKRLQEGGATPNQFIPGKTYKATIYTSDGGKKYINSFELAQDGEVGETTPVEETPRAATPKKVFGGSKKGKDDDMSKDEWAKKDRMTRAVAIYKSTLESPLLVNVVQTKNEEELAEFLATTANALIDRLEAKIAEIN